MVKIYDYIFEIWTLIINALNHRQVLQNYTIMAGRVKFHFKLKSVPVKVKV